MKLQSLKLGLGGGVYLLHGHWPILAVRTEDRLWRLSVELPGWREAFLAERYPGARLARLHQSSRLFRSSTIPGQRFTTRRDALLAWQALAELQDE